MLARHAKLEWREHESGRSALGAELTPLLDATLEQLIIATTDSRAAKQWIASHFSQIAAKAANLGIRPENSEREAALWSVLDGEFVRLIERASLHHVVTMVWALGKVDALTAKTWAPAERLVVSRGIEKFNKGLGFEKRAEHDEAGPMMTDLAMLMHGFGNRGLPVPELCARVASSLPRYLRELRKSKREREHVSVVNILWALAKIEYTEPSVYVLLADECLFWHRHFTSQNVTNVVWAFATASLPAPEHSEPLLKALALYATPRVSDFVEQGVSMTLWAYASTGVQAPALFAAFARSNRHRLHSFNEQGLTNLLWSFGKAAIDAPELFEEGLRTALPLLTTYTAEHQSQLMQALAFSTYRAPLVHKAASTICLSPNALAESDPQAIVVASHSMAVVGFALPAPFVERMVHALIKKSPDSRHITMLGWALVTSADNGGMRGSALTALLEVLCLEALRTSRGFINKDRGLFAWALWKGCCEHASHGLTGTAERTVLELTAGITLNDISDHDLANIATVFQHVGTLRLPPALVLSIPNEVRSGTHSFIPCSSIGQSATSDDVLTHKLALHRSGSPIGEFAAIV